MKKRSGLVCFLVAMSLLFVPPTTTLASDDDVYFDLSGDPLSKLYIEADVCKIDDCINVGAVSDWYNYSITSENVEGDMGAGQTLVVSPGDTLTLLGTTSVVGGATISPTYGIEFTNGSYLTVDNIFSDEFDDVDNDSINFIYLAANNIILSDDLVGDTDPQIGAITATVNSDTPDGTVITGTFYVVIPDLALTMLAPQRALAADDDLYLRSTIRVLVSDPAPVQTVTANPTATVATTTTTATDNVTTATLPATGASTKSQSAYYVLLLSIVIAGGVYYFIKRAKRQY